MHSRHDDLHRSSAVTVCGDQHEGSALALAGLTLPELPLEQRRSSNNRRPGKRCVFCPPTRPSIPAFFFHLLLLSSLSVSSSPRARLCIALGKRMCTVVRFTQSLIFLRTDVDLRRHSRFRRVSSFSHYNDLADRQHYSAKLC